MSTGQPTSSHIRLTCPLFIPGNRADMLSKASRYSASAFIPDFEDSVPIAEKVAAAEITARMMPELVATGIPIIPRVNSLASGLAQTELEAIVGSGIAGISIGKIRSADDIHEIDEMLASIEPEIGTTAILPWLESAAAVVNAYDICSASPRVRWVAFGAEDYSADMGISRETDRATDPDSSGMRDIYGEASLLYPRSAVATAARAADVQALDTPYVRFRDTAGLRTEASLARSLGYTGKFAIHPAQIDAIRAIWMPSEAEIERARRVLRAADDAEKTGRGAVSLDGEMIDAPVVARARNVLANAGTS